MEKALKPSPFLCLARGNTMKLENIDFLFLDYMSEFLVPIHILTAPIVDEILNKPHHRLTKNQVNEKINSLINQGFIEPKGDRYFGLTKKGGAAWEKHFSPKWDMYIDWIGHYKFDREMGYLKSVSKQTLQALLDFKTDYIRFNKIRIIQDWAPLYWKDNAPTAYKLFFMVNISEDELSPHDRACRDEFYNFFWSFDYHWKKEWGHDYQDGIAWSDKYLRQGNPPIFSCAQK